MLTENISMNIFLCHLEVFGNTTFQSCGIQNRTGTDNLILRQTGNFSKYISHDIYRIAYDYVKSIRSCFYDLRRDTFQDIDICLGQLNSGLTWFTCNTGGDDYDIGIFCIFILTGNDGNGITEAGSLLNIHHFAFHFVFVDINQYNL